MQTKKVVTTGLKILAVCLLFTVCMSVGVFLSGLDRAAQQGRPAQTSSQTAPQTTWAEQVSPPPPATEPAPGKILLPLLIFSLCVGTVVSYLILRSSWHGWTLAGAIFVGTYGISTVVNQIESMFFLSNKFPPGLIRAIFVQGAIAYSLVRASRGPGTGQMAGLRACSASRAPADARRFRRPESRSAGHRLRIPVHVLWLLRGLAEP